MKRYRTLDSLFFIEKELKKENVNFDRKLDTFRLDGTLYVNMKKYTFSEKEIESLNSTNLYVYNELSELYGGIDTWWIGISEENAYEIHCLEKNGHFYILMTEHDSYPGGNYIIFEDFKEFFKYITTQI